MKIAYFNANLKVGQDGVTRCVYKMIDGAIERGHKAIAVTSTPPSSEMSIPIYGVPSVILPLQKSYRIAIPGYQAFAQYLEEFQPDILHVNSPCTLGYSAMKYGRQFGIPVVATYHTHFPTYLRYYNLDHLEELTWRLSRRLYNKVDRTFVPALPILHELDQHGIQRLEYLPNGIDTGAFGPINRSDEWRRRFGKGENPVILFVSRLVWEKDLRVLAQAFTELRSHRDDFEMVIVGDGHARREFEEMMPGAHFLGYQSGRTLAESYASADIFAFPSATETFGNSLLEAMGSGLPPLVAAAGGVLEFSQHGGNAWLVAPNSVSAIAEGLRRLLEDAALRRRLSEGALRTAHERGWDEVDDQLIADYQDAIENPRLIQAA